MYCRHFEFGNVTWSRVDQSDNFRRWNNNSNARKTHDKFREAYKEHEWTKSREITCTRIAFVWRTVSSVFTQVFLIYCVWRRNFNARRSSIFFECLLICQWKAFVSPNSNLKFLFNENTLKIQWSNHLNLEVK